MGVKLNLVTVVGDFHKNLTLISMLKHYMPLVDKIYINYYLTGKSVDKEQKQLEFLDFLKHSNVYQDNVFVRTSIGDKYDWDEVTRLYNNTVTCIDQEAYWIIADCDEFQVWPKSPRDIAEECEERGYTFVTGGFLDRLGENGNFPEITANCDLDTLFPLAGFFRYPISKACPNKVVMVAGGQKVTSGQHYAFFRDGSNSWGKEHTFRYPVEECFVQVHHFKWDSTILNRLEEVSNSGCKYSEEYLLMRDGIREGKLDLKNKAYMFERYLPELGYDSYRHWNKVKNIIIGV